MVRNKPLQGLAVVETGTMISVPTSGRLLADFGADVIKIEHPEYGDHSRQFGPQKDGVGIWWKYVNRNKKCVTLDLKSERGQEVFRDLVSEADVVLENFRPGTLERWNVGYESLTEVNPDLIMLRLTGYGQYGPQKDLPGFGTLAEAMSGFASINGFPDRPPLLPPTGLADQIAALYGTLSVMYALYHRDVNEGGGQYIDTTLIESMLNVTGPQALRYDQTGEMEKRTGNQSTSSAPRNVYRTKDDRWVAIAASTQPLAMRVFDAIGRSDFKTDPRFETNEDRLDHKDELDEIIQGWMLEHTREEVLERFKEHDASVAPVYNIEDIMADEHYQDRETIIQIHDDELGEASLQNVHPKFSDTPGVVEYLGPSLGEHNEEVYKRRLGYSDELFDELESNEVI